MAGRHSQKAYTDADCSHSTAVFCGSEKMIREQGISRENICANFAQDHIICSLIETITFRVNSCSCDDVSDDEALVG